MAARSGLKVNRNEDLPERVREFQADSRSPRMGQGEGLGDSLAGAGAFRYPGPVVSVETERE